MGNRKIEIVREFTYLGHKLQENNGEEKYAMYIAAKARAVMGRIWSIGEKLCREEWKKRMRLFEALVESIMMYGVEIWGCKEWEEIERI